MCVCGAWQSKVGQITPPMEKEKLQLLTGLFYF